MRLKTIPKIMVIFINTKIMKQCIHVLISLAAFSLQLKLRSLESLKLCPIIDQGGTYVYNASKVVAKYLPTRQQDVVASCHNVSLYIPASSHVRPNNVLMERRHDVSAVRLVAMS